MNGKRFPLVAAALVAWPAHGHEIRPVTAADLAGKTICWDNGWRMTYAKDGSYFGARVDAHAVNPHTAEWSMSEEGVGAQRRITFEEIDGRVSRLDLTRRDEAARLK